MTVTDALTTNATPTTTTTTAETTITPNYNDDHNDNIASLNEEPEDSNTGVGLADKIEQVSISALPAFSVKAINRSGVSEGTRGTKRPPSPSFDDAYLANLNAQRKEG